MLQDEGSAVPGSPARMLTECQVVPDLSLRMLNADGLSMFSVQLSSGENQYFPQSQPHNLFVCLSPLPFPSILIRS